MSGTSFTEDEDFMVMVDALDLVQERMNMSDKKLPNVRVLVTGKGPLKAQYEEIFETKSESSWSNIKVETAWLEADDYPRLVGSADLGVCFHTSSSGYDLPMKVVDMFAASLPAFAIYYEAIHELVKEKQNGRIFENKQ